MTEYIENRHLPSADSARSTEGNILFPPHRREYEDCKQILKLSLNPTHKLNARQDFSQHSCQKTCPMGRAESEDCQSASATLLHPVNPLPSITRSARLNKQRSGDFRLFPPANFANSAILPTDKISAFFMQNFLLQKPKDSSWSMPLSPHRGRMIAFATAVRSGPSALRGPRDSSFAGI